MTHGTRRMAAPLHQILDVVLDLEAYPSWSADVSRAEVTARTPDGVPSRGVLHLAAGPVRDDLVLDYAVTSGPDRATMTWRLVSAKQVRDLQGCYQLEAVDARATDVTYLLDVDPGLPLHSALKAKMQERIIAAALDSLQRRVEA